MGLFVRECESKRLRENRLTSKVMWLEGGDEKVSVEEWERVEIGGKKLRTRV